MRTRRTSKPGGTPSGAWQKARPAADASIARLCHALYREDPGSVPVPAAQIRRTLTRLRTEPLRGMALALEIAGRIEGYALLITYWSNELGGELVALDEIYVTPAHRGQGHASGLIRQLIADRSLWPARPAVLELEVSPANRRARDLYLRLGFQAIRNTTLRIVRPRPIRSLAGRTR